MGLKKGTGTFIVAPILPWRRPPDCGKLPGMPRTPRASVALRVLAWCLMPKHYHLVLWTLEDGDLSRWMHWLQNTHVRRYHRHYHTAGHLWQGRYKAFPIAHDEYLLTALRYVERNGLRAGLCARVEDYPWSSAALAMPGAARPAFWHPGPVARPEPWLAWVQEPATLAEEAALRACLVRGRPYGPEPWQRATAAALGLEATLRPRGLPRKGAAEK